MTVLQSVILRGLLVIVGIAPVAAAQNLVQNGSFNGSFQGWSTVQGSGISLKATPYAEVTAQIAPGGSIAANPIFQNVPIQPLTPYTLSGNINIAAPCSGCRAYMRLTFFDGQGQAIASHQSPGWSSTDGFYTDLVAATSPGNAVLGSVGLWIEGQGGPNGSTFRADFTAIQLVATGGCKFGSSLAITPSTVAVGSDFFMTWCNPSYVLGPNSSYAVNFYRISYSSTANGPFKVLGDLAGASNTIDRFSTDTGDIGTTYFVIDAHGCLNTSSGPCGNTDTVMRSNTADLVVTALASPTAGISALPDSIHTGEKAVLVWSSSQGTSVSIDNGVGVNLAASGSVTVAPAKTTKYTLQVQAGNTIVTSSTTVTVLTVPPPAITSLAAVPGTVNAGTATTLSWVSTGGKTATIDNAVGSVAAAGGSKSVTPSRTTTYTLTVKGDGGSTTRSLTVQVNNTPPPPAVKLLSGNGQPGMSDGTGPAVSFTRPFAVSVVNTTASSAGLALGLPETEAAITYDMYVLDSNHTIRKISPDGTTVTYAGQPGVPGSANGFRTAATFDFSNYVGGIIANSDGSLLVVDNSGRRRLIDAAGQVSLYRPPGCSASCGNSPLPSGIVKLPDGTIYSSDAGNHTVTRVSPTGLTTIMGIAGQPGLRDGPGNQAEFNRPRGMTIDAAGNVYVLDTGNNAIRKIDGFNVVSTLTVSGSATGGGDLTMGCCNSGIAAGPHGSVYTTDPGSNSIKQVSADGTITTVAGSGTAGAGNGSGSVASFNNPLGITTAPDGSLVVTDTNNNTVRSVQPSPLPSRHRPVKH